MPKLIRVTTVPMSLKVLLRGQMRFMQESGFEVIMVSADGKELEDVKAFEKCPHHLVNMTRQITPVKDLAAVWQLYRYFKKEKPDIVHSHTPKAGLLAMIAARMSGVPVRIHTVAGLRFMTTSGNTRRILVQMEKLTYKFANHVWPNSQSILKYMVEHKLVNPAKLDMIGKGSSNGINLERFSTAALLPGRIEEVKASIKYDPQLFYLLAVGRIVKDKGIDELVQAFAKLYESNNSLRLVLVGSLEDDLDPISDAARELLHTHPGIISAGWHDEVEYFMHIANLFVHASYREGFPNVLLQAGAMGCPVVCSRIPGNIDIVDDKITGRIFTVKDAADLHHQLHLAISDMDTMKNMAIALRQKIENYFDQRYIRQAMKEKYDELLSARASK